MNARRIIRQVRAALEQALPDAGTAAARLWFARLCAVSCMEANGMYTPGSPLPQGLRLFEGVQTLPQALDAAQALLREIPRQTWQKSPELTGWLYQYWVTPEREAAFAGLRQNVKIPPERIAAATQLFTPRWIAQYMAQNTLAAVCRPLPEWAYVLGEPPAGGKAPSGLRVLDPCMGTGQILTEVFDALMALYLADGAAPEQAAECILRDNLIGMDIDGTAASVGEFVLRMKAARYLPDALTGNLRMQVYDLSAFEEMLPGISVCGSLLRPAVCGTGETLAVTELLQSRFDAVITNPPYMGAGSMPPELSAFVKAEYPLGKADLFACFMERCAALTKPDGVFSMLTMHGWMFLSRFRALRHALKRNTIGSMVHLGSGAFDTMDVGTIVQTTAFTAFGRELVNYPAVYVRLTEVQDKASHFHDPALRYTCTRERMAALPGEPLCYWCSDRMLAAMKAPKLDDVCRICQGMTTSDNKRFVRRWYEVEPGSIAFGCRSAEEAAATGKTWFPYNKGGPVRRWYGNHSFVVNYRSGGEALRAFHAELNRTRCGGRLKNADMYFKPGITWSFITESGRFGVRVQPEGFLFDVSGSCLFPAEEDRLYLMGLLSSSVVREMLRMTNPTMNFQAENLRSLPYLPGGAYRPEIASLVAENIRLAQEDWDESEESWAFRMHPLLQTGEGCFAGALRAYRERCQQRSEIMRRNEERLNRLFAEIYHVEGEVDCGVTDGLQVPSERETAEQLISFAVGCALGRYAYPDMQTADYLPLSEIGTVTLRLLAAAFPQDTLPELERCLTALLGCTAADYGKKEFWTAHCRRYHKRPVYWFLRSGAQQDAMRGLVYYHMLGPAPAADFLRAAELAGAYPEREAFLEKIRMLSDTKIDRDAGIQANYARFRSVLGAIR
ncbi:MAG: hypothetical protein IKN55_02275 [Oscillospiraceae bacterium]|nr:hypothetical protein [Oscillospiraceae bacterium]